MIVVSNTTPLNYLILIGSDHLLPALFGRIHAPAAVMMELSHPKTPASVRAWVKNPPEWLIPRDPVKTDPTLNLGAGETAAIALAEELRADWVLIDERKGSREATSRGLRVAGTLTLLEEAAARGVLDYGKAVDRLVNETTFHVTEDILKQSEERYRKRRP